MKNLIAFSVILIITVMIGAFVYSQADSFVFSSETNSLNAQGSALLGKIEVEDKVQSEQKTNIYREWPVYESNEYSFTMRYPENLRVNSKASEILRSNENNRTLVQFYEAGGENSRGTSITVSASLANDRVLEDLARELSDRGSVLSHKEITIDGNRAMKLIITTPLEGEKLREYYTITKIKGNFLVFNSLGQENKEVFEQMLDTIKFSY